MCIFLDKWYGICIFLQKKSCSKTLCKLQIIIILLSHDNPHIVGSTLYCQWSSLSSSFFRHMFSIFQSATRCLIFSGMLWFLRTALGSKMSFSNEQDWQFQKILQREGEIQRQSWNASWRLVWAPLELQNDVKAVDQKCENLLAYWSKMWKFSR